MTDRRDGGETCQRCHDIGEDRRTLWMACFYEMNELKVPFEMVEVGGKRFYTLRVCKVCRGEWMSAIKKWFTDPKQEEARDSGIFIRENGATIQISESEWYRRNPGREPVRVKHD